MLKNRSIPDSSVIPVLNYPDVRAAAEWLRDNIGFKERLRIGTHRCQLLFGNSALVVAETSAVSTDLTHTVMLRVTELDQILAKAVGAGAKVVTEPANHPYGERQASFLDPWGHRWTLSQTIADSDPKDWGGEFIE